MEQLYWNTCRWLLQSLIVLQTLISASSGPLGTGCVWRSSMSSTMPKEQEITPRPECLEGQLWWYYPIGELYVTFEPESKEVQFELCIPKDQFDAHEEVYHLEGRTKNLLDLTRQDESVPNVCVKSHRGQVLLQFSSPISRQRLKIIEYFRRDPT